MNISGPLKFAFAFILPMSLVASTIPVYQVTSTDYASINLTNDAVFVLSSDSWENVHAWNNGDQVILYHNEQHFPQPIVNVGGVPVLLPVFLALNSTQGKSVFTYLSEPPQLNLLTILTIDALSGTVTLDDASVWHVREIDHRYFEMWNVGDIVLIGHNSSIDRDTYDAFILNATHIQVAHAVSS